MRRELTGSAIGLVLMLLAVTGCDRKPSPAAPVQPTGPNVLLISIDMLRPDHLGCYGYFRPTSPRIDGLAAEGVLFENHISSTSWTLPAHAALFTSLADSVHGCTDTDRKLADSHVTLAERFAAAGYRTVGFFSGPYLHPAFGLGQGFAHYENCTSYAQAIDQNPVAKWAMDRRVMESSHRDITNPHVYAAFLKWLDANSKSKFFMFVHLWDVHFDFIPPPPYDRMFDPDYTGTVTGENFFFDPRINKDMPRRDLEHLLALYDGEIACTDSYVGRMVDDLRAAGLLDDTVVVVTSDHGTEFFEHGGKAHRMTLFDEVIRIPLVARYPAKLPAGRRVSAQSRIIDIGPLLLELAGIGGGRPEVMGRSLVRIIQQKPPDYDNTAISELASVGRNLRSIRTPEWKFTHVVDADRAFYHLLLDDPGEQHALTDLGEGFGRQLVEKYQSVLRDLEGWRARLGHGPEQSTVPADVMKQLQSIGYVGDGEGTKGGKDEGRK